MPSWNELFDPNERVAMVTGGAMGIGEGIARRLAEQGASVVVADLDATKGAQTAEELTRHGPGTGCFVPTDMRDPTQVERLVDTTVRERGRLDIVVNTAGIFPMSAALSVSPELWDKVLEVNLRGPFFLAQAAARRMKAQGGGGAIVNIASIDALHPTGQLAPYDASKGG